jgi:hypothetical protein
MKPARARARGVGGGPAAGWDRWPASGLIWGRCTRSLWSAGPRRGPRTPRWGLRGRTPPITVQLLRQQQSGALPSANWACRDMEGGGGAATDRGPWLQPARGRWSRVCGRGCSGAHGASRTCPPRARERVRNAPWALGDAERESARRKGRTTSTSAPGRRPPCHRGAPGRPGHPCTS